MSERCIYLFQDNHFTGEVVYRAVYRNGEGYSDITISMNADLFLVGLKSMTSFKKWPIVDGFPVDLNGNKVNHSRIENPELRSKLNLSNEQFVDESCLEGKVAKY